MVRRDAQALRCSCSLSLRVIDLSETAIHRGGRVSWDTEKGVLWIKMTGDREECTAPLALTRPLM